MPITQLSLQDVQLTVIPNWYHRKKVYGCYYFVDYDGDLGYFIQSCKMVTLMKNNVQYVDFDTMSDDEA